MKNNWFSLYLRAVIAVLISLVLYVGLLPQAVSARDSFVVICGIAGALLWPALIVLYFRHLLRKLLKCAKF